MRLHHDKTERKKVGIHQSTYDQLKDLSRFNAIKLRWLIDAMVDEILRNDDLKERIVENALKKQQQDGDY